MQNLLALDHQLFNLIFYSKHYLLMDWVAIFLSGIGMGGFIWLLLSVILFIREERRDHWFFLPVVSATVLSQLVTNNVLKNFFGRMRPTGALLSSFSFPSGHATFAWALAVVLAAKEPRAKFLFYLLALLISFSRIYLGVHYPLDIIAGSLIGITIGHVSLGLESLVIQYRHAQIKRKRTPHQSRR